MELDFDPRCDFEYAGHRIQVVWFEREAHPIVNDGSNLRQPQAYYLVSDGEWWDEPLPLGMFVEGEAGFQRHLRQHIDDLIRRGQIG